MNFSQVDRVLQTDPTVVARRRIWGNDDLKFIFFVQGKSIPTENWNVDKSRSCITRDFLEARGLTALKLRGHYDMWANNEYVTGWLPSQEDLQAEDWLIEKLDQEGDIDD
jgi:hypothetical protein